MATVVLFQIRDGGGLSLELPDGLEWEAFIRGIDGKSGLTCIETANGPVLINLDHVTVAGKASRGPALAVPETRLVIPNPNGTAPRRSGR